MSRHLVVLLLTSLSTTKKPRPLARLLTSADSQKRWRKTNVKRRRKCRRKRGESGGEKRRRRRRKGKLSGVGHACQRKGEEENQG